MQGVNAYINCLGIFIITPEGSIRDKELFDEATALKFLETGQIPKSDLLEKNKDAKIFPTNKIPPPHILEALRNETFFDEFRNKNITFARKKVRESFTRDELIIQTVLIIEDLDRHTNGLVKRAKDWYAIISPELVHELESNERFIKVVSSKEHKEILADLDIHSQGSMMPSIPEKDLLMARRLTEEASQLYELRDEYSKYLDELMKEICPNIQAIVGTMIGAKLLAIAGGLSKLSLFPASTVQLLGAEKALFRHLKTGAKPPKFGVLMTHPLVSSAAAKDRGKIARALADKVAIASKVDIYKGDFVGDALRKMIEKRFLK